VSAALLFVLALALIAFGLFLTLAIGLARGSLDLFRTVIKLGATAAPDARAISEGAQRAQVRIAAQQKRFQEVQESLQRGFRTLGRG